jgi:hypothetical protein
LVNIEYQSNCIRILVYWILRPLKINNWNDKREQEYLEGNYDVYACKDFALFLFFLKEKEEKYVLIECNQMFYIRSSMV